MAEGVENLRFIRAGKIARNLDLSIDAVRRQVKAGVYGVPHFMNGEWCVPLASYERFVLGATVAPPVKASQLVGLRRGGRVAVLAAH